MSSTLRRAVVAITATTAVAGGGLALAAEASAAPPPSSWGCAKPYKTTYPDGVLRYGVQCFDTPNGHKIQLVLRCKNIQNGNIRTILGPWVDRHSGSEVKASACTASDGSVTTWGPRRD